MVFGAVGIGMHDWKFVDIGIKANAATCSLGEIIEFGSYPQTEVTDKTLLAELNSQDLEWFSYNYYSGYYSGDRSDRESAHVGDWMQYADVIYKDDKYRAVKFSSYRPILTYIENSAENSEQDDNGYFTDIVYWFKYEPIKWLVLDPAEGLILSEIVLDSQVFNNVVVKERDENYLEDENWIEEYKYYSGSSYANDYSQSDIREWLNNDFYDMAFTTEEKAEIYETVNYNLCENPRYTNATTTDNVFLLTYDDMYNTEYGFTSEEDVYGYRTINREPQSSDYAKCQGVEVNFYNSTSPYMTRTAAVFSDRFYVGGIGTSVEYSSYGIRPSLQVDLNSFNTYSNVSLGDVVEFGSYPQSLVTDTLLIDKLNNQTINWYYYDYYSSGKKSLYMQYADVTLGNEKYRAVTFSRYRPTKTDRASERSSSYQDDNGYLANNVYWFKYEKVKWEVLDPDTGLVISQNVIDSQPYVNNVYVYQGSAYSDNKHTKLAETYNTSYIREWLNTTFWNTAFSNTEKNLVNSYYISYCLPTQASESINDKVGLLSRYDVSNADYGFKEDYTLPDENRLTKASEYAYCQGLESNDNGYPSWRLLGGYFVDKIDSCANIGTQEGSLNGVVIYDYTSIGIRPCIKLDLNSVNIVSPTENSLRLVSVSPNYNATAVSYTDSVVLTFNKNIKTNLLSGQYETDTEIAIRSYTTDEPIYSTYEMNPESFPIESGNQLIIPFALLKMIPGEKYYVYISPNSIRAADNFFGEKFEGITDKDAYTFSNFTPSITEGYSLDLFSANGNIEVKPGEEVSVAAILSLDGIPDNTNGITFTISDTSIAEITKIDKQSDRIVVFIKGNQQGITTLSVNADNADRNISAPVFVNDDKAVYYPSDLYKFDEDNPLITQGMFLTDFDFEENDNGETSAKFNVYNADCCTGIVDVYDSKGVCVESVLIDMFDGDYPTDIFDHMEYAGELIYNVFEIFDPAVIIQKAYTEKTSVSIDIPHNGYITVTKDVAASDALLVYDVVTLSLEAISCASDVIDHFSSEEEEDVKKAVAEKILVKISETWLKKIRNSFIDYSTQNKSTDDFIYALFSDIDSALAESGDDFIDILTETAAETLPDVVFDDLKKHILKDFGIDIVDKIFYKSVKVVKWATIFNYISVYLMDESLVIYASQDGETKYSNGAKAQLSEDDENIVFHSVMITTGEKADALNVINEDTKLFEISLIKNGKVYDPYKTVAVYLPIPEGWDTEKLTVYHLTDDYKTREKLDVVIENGYVKFETEGFSPFILANGELSFIDSISIKTPSTTTINYGDTLVLHADIANIPNGAKIEWSVYGDGVSISPSDDGKTCAVTSKKSREFTVSMKLVDDNGTVVKNLAGEELVSTQKLSSKAGFFQKIISFLKNLFGMNRVIVQAFKGII